ncbi:TPA_asm: 50S ribosomal protein L25 [Listeria monocytogenes]|uniref:50S ribosomal protein L25/general stress protein Ctc n=1 Tax=Listeria monocytogenes TaxID=1639 RepID=UPI000BDE7E6B|nr:50S ribosomal protein L25/general stress protein Ctc [Listeria monocytogenes]EAE3191662.1 50S ribosomal protein L25/general stress protein Ctc [Listeria monocytogenes]EAE3232675.1 50S ribosomal protein L25/general stress protein Ctc [Listeria monocytogenes]EAE4721869.1 50S ribosomal protein L25/general stress protein Ctc [Listeria monocytogenes]EAE5197087.1 50S ribosomal protein L25/general stress protein Ctc [Listeria monocytogenes]EAE5215626.1 50S ribosomal protein L25/general stress prot
MATTLEVQKRETTQHSEVTRLRSEGKVPGIIYGYKSENVPVSVDSLELIKAVRDNGRNAVFSVTVDGKKLNVLLHEYQVDPLKDVLVHVDLLAVDMNEEVETDVRVVLVGDAPGVKAGGVLQQIIHDVKVSATPEKLPETIELDISLLEIGDVLTTNDLPENKDYVVQAEEEETVVTVSAPRAEEEPTTTEAPEPEAVHGKDEEPVE